MYGYVNIASLFFLRGVLLDENQKVLIKDRMADAYVSKEHSLYDQDQAIRGRLPLLELVHEKFIMDLFPKLTALTGKPIKLWMLSTDLLKFDEFVKSMNESVDQAKFNEFVDSLKSSTETARFGGFVNSLKIPTLLQNIKSDNFKSNFTIATDRDLFALLSNVILGGEAEKTPGGSQLTNTDLKIARDLSELTLSSFNTAFRSFCGDLHKDFTLGSFESNPQFWGLCAPSDVVITTTFEIEIGGIAGKFHIIFPHKALSSDSPVSFSRSFQQPDKSEKKAIKLSKDSLSAIVASEIKLEAMTVMQARELKVGDVLNFNEINDNAVITTKKGV